MPKTYVLATNVLLTQTIRALLLRREPCGDPPWWWLKKSTIRRSDRTKLAEMPVSFHRKRNGDSLASRSSDSHFAVC